MSVAAGHAVALSALRIVSFVPLERDAVHVGLLASDAQHVVDLVPLGINDVLDALTQSGTLRQTAGAIMHGAARTELPVRQVHLVAPIPMARSVVFDGDTDEIVFADPTTLHGPGGHLRPTDAAHARVGLAAVVGETLSAAEHPDEHDIQRALIGSLLVLGWSQEAPGGAVRVLPGAIGPFVALPLRHPDSLALTLSSPDLSAAPSDAERRRDARAPVQADFVALARRALTTHSLRTGDLLVIFPARARISNVPIRVGFWVRASAPGLGTLSLAVR
jgi:hypothetical protein